VNPWSALLNGGMLAQGRSGGNEEGGSEPVANFQEDGDGSKMALRYPGKERRAIKGCSESLAERGARAMEVADSSSVRKKCSTTYTTVDF
jgi:hypothetical protein